jgi:outer membrane lipoprotein-sorting protein
LKTRAWFIYFLFLLSAGRAFAQDDAARYLEGFEKKYSALKDYTVDVKVHFGMEGFNAPDMQAKLYFKPPDKMKVESKKVFFFPKEGGLFNPFLFKKEAFDIRLLEEITYDNRKAVRLRLIPKDMKKMKQSFVLTLDVENFRIREFQTTSEDREVKGVIHYVTFEEFDLPARIELHLDLPFKESFEVREFGQPEAAPRRVTGKVEIAYSNYRANSGLRDELFETPKRKK